MAEDLWGWLPQPLSVPQAGFSSGEQTPSLDDHEGPGRPLLHLLISAEVKSIASSTLLPVT